jgi:hypothetical protein
MELVDNEACRTIIEPDLKLNRRWPYDFLAHWTNACTSGVDEVLSSRG